MLIMAILSTPMLGFRIIMADISTEIDVWRNALIGWMLLRGAVLLVFGGNRLPLSTEYPRYNPYHYMHVLITENKQGFYIAGN